MGIFWKFARIGERLSPYISICCVFMAVRTHPSRLFPISPPFPSTVLLKLLPRYQWFGAIEVMDSSHVSWHSLAMELVGRKTAFCTFGWAGCLRWRTAHSTRRATVLNGLAADGHTQVGRV